MKNKSWDAVWEKIFKTQEWGKYPPEELIRFIARNYYKCKNRKDIKILDVGCGTGAATWYLTREGFSAYGIDGSKTAIQIAQKRLESEKLNGEFKIGDIINLEEYADDTFDCVVDIVALQHNTYENIKKIINEIRRVLKKDGLFFTMMISKESQLKEDGPLSNKGKIHYFDKKEIKELFIDFNDIIIDISSRTDKGNSIIHFISSARK